MNYVYLKQKNNGHGDFYQDDDAEITVWQEEGNDIVMLRAASKYGDPVEIGTKEDLKELIDVLSKMLKKY